MGWEWLLAGFVWLGTRKRIRLRDLIGGRWATAEDFFLDVVYAGTFWICAAIVLVIGAKLMHLDQAGKIEAMRKQLGFLTPGSNLELAVWFGVSLTAGFCEEIIFRGYLQRQFAAIANSMMIGVLFSAVVFGASHGYEGAPRMILIGIYGLMFGLLAWWRKSLRAGNDGACVARRAERRTFANAEIASVYAVRTHVRNSSCELKEGAAESIRGRESEILSFASSLTAHRRAFFA